MTKTDDHSDHQQDAPDYFEQPGWDARYSGSDKIWSGRPNPQLVAEVSGLTPGTALDVGCGEGGDVIWLAQQGWAVTGADFSTEGLTRAAEHAEEAGVADRTYWWQVDARTFEAEGRQFDLVTTHFLHTGSPMVDVVRRLTSAVAPGGHLLVVGHAPSEVFTRLSADQHRAMWHAEDLLPALADGFEAVVVEERPRVVERDGKTVEVGDATLLVRRVGSNGGVGQGQAASR
jgi:2-polyprenyl-3-methyl-5-hydroxy-6-metoxy-1,4-benzoquinol methylase